MNIVSSVSYAPWIALSAPNLRQVAKTTPLRANATLVEAAAFRAVAGLRKALTAIGRSLTALGNSANAYFAQLSATLALDRAAHSMAHAVGIAPRCLFPFTPFSNPFSSLPAFQPLTATHFATAAMENSFAMFANTFGAMASGFGFWTPRR